MPEDRVKGRWWPPSQATGWRAIALTAARSALSGIALLVLYIALPIGVLDHAPWAFLVISGLVFLAVLGWQLRTVTRSHAPGLRSIEAIGILLPLAVFVFASIYVIMSADDVAAFTQPIDKVDGVYFSVTILSTVGFGDITAVSDAARLAVTVQMLLDLVLIAAVANAIRGAVARGSAAKAGSEKGHQ